MYVTQYFTLWAELGECRLIFSEPKYAVTVTETPANDSTIDSSPPTPVVGAAVTTTCTGDDGSPVSDIRYSILEGDLNAFSIDVMTGEFSVSVQPFDYEEQQWYSVTLLCFLESDSSINGTGEVNVTIAPINEYVPVITSNSDSNIIQLHEDTPLGIPVASTIPGLALFTYTATDKDRGPDGKIIFTLSPSSIDYLDLNSMTGTLSLQKEVDYDNLQGENPVINISITACNEDLPLNSCNNIALEVYIIPTNDNTPYFSQAEYSLSVLESAVQGTVIGQVTCLDDDRSTGTAESVSLYNASDSSAALFQIVSNSDRNSLLGSVVLEGVLDYDQGADSYQFQVICVDGGNEALAQVTVDVLPVNDNPPYFTEQLYQFSVERTSSAGHPVGQVQAEDEDIGNGSSIIYTIEDSTRFDITFYTGEITIKDDILSSEGSLFILRVFANDGEFIANATVRISVRGPLSFPEFVAVISGVCGFVLLVVIILLLIGSCCCYYIRATRSRYIYNISSQQ